MSKIIAIDPGNKESALVILTKNASLFSKKPKKSETRIIYKHKDCNSDLRKFLKAYLQLSGNSLLLIETIKSYGNVQGDSLIQTAIAIGRFVEIAESFKVKTFLIPRKTYVTALCKSPQANDTDIRAKMIEIYGKPGTKTQPGVTYGFKADLWQALGLATYGCQLP